VTSRLIAQAAEDHYVAAVYDDCFDPDGSEIYLKKPHFYTALEQPVPWLAIQATAAAVHEVALGYVDADGEHHLNPPQDAAVTLSADCRLVLVSEDDGDYTD
jgi:hypothetical protein